MNYLSFIEMILQLPRRNYGNWSESREGQGVFLVSGSGVPKDLACVGLVCPGGHILDACLAHSDNCVVTQLILLPYAGEVYSATETAPK